MAPSGVQYFSSPEQEAAGKTGVPGQAGYNEQDEFHDPQGKYKLVMKGVQHLWLHLQHACPWMCWTH
jgi:hypothetical protein